MEKLLVLLEREDNKLCADCKAPEPTHCNVCVGVFICNSCARIHESIPEINDRIVRIDTYEWSIEEVEELKGNSINNELEKIVPPYFVRPTPGEERVYEEIYARAKYVTKLFENISVQKLNPSTSGLKTGNLLFIETLPLDGSVIWYPRYLSLECQELNVYQSRIGLEPILTIKLDDLVVKMEQEKNTVTKGLAFIHFFQKGTCPNTYYFFSDPKETIDWYYAILCAQSHSDRKQRADRNKFAASTTLNRAGYIHKTGSRINDKWRKRWFVVRDTTVCYYKTKDSHKPCGVFTLCGNTRVSKIESGPFYHTRKSPTPNTFLVCTPGRIYRLCAESKEDEEEWIRLFENILFLKNIA